MPRRKSTLADELALVPWWVSIFLAGAAFIFLPALLPPAMRTFTFPVCLFFLAMAGIWVLRSLKNRTMLEQQTSLESLRQLPWKRFEICSAKRFDGKDIKSRRLSAVALMAAWISCWDAIGASH